MDKSRKELFVAGYKASGAAYYDYEIDEAWERYVFHEKNPRDEFVVFNRKISVALAEWIIRAQMTDHPNFDAQNREHMAMLKEFVELKRALSKEIAK